MAFLLGIVYEPGTRRPLAKFGPFVWNQQRQALLYHDRLYDPENPDDLAAFNADQDAAATKRLFSKEGRGNKLRVRAFPAELPAPAPAPVFTPAPEPEPQTDPDEDPDDIEDDSPASEADTAPVTPPAAPVDPFDAAALGALASSAPPPKKTRKKPADTAGG